MLFFSFENVLLCIFFFDFTDRENNLDVETATISADEKTLTDGDDEEEADEDVDDYEEHVDSVDKIIRHNQQQALEMYRKNRPTSGERPVAKRLIGSSGSQAICLLNFISTGLVLCLRKVLNI